MRNIGTASPGALSGPKPLSEPVTTRVTIKTLGRQGDGVADGPVFVSRTLPGEVVEGQLSGNRLEDMRIITPSDQRVAPPCKHFKACGGCLLQHGSDTLVADWKRDIVALALGEHGIETTLREHVETSPQRSRRRARFTARRTKSGAMAGFHARASDTVIDLVDCPLIAPDLQQGPAIARALARVGTSRKAEIAVQCIATADGMDVSVTGGKPLDRELQQALPQIATEFGCVRLTWNGDLVAQTAPARHRIGTAAVTLPPGAFLQATDHGEATLRACVREAIPGATRIVDLFAGCGTFALDLAELAPVNAFESEKPMVDALQEAANHAGLTYPVAAHVRDLFRDPLTGAELSKFDAIVLDPPRAGAVAQIREIAKSGVGQIAYVSCDPATFARDAAVLTDAGYVTEWVQVVDQFRWSAHVELAARFILTDI